MSDTLTVVYDWPFCAFARMHGFRRTIDGELMLLCRQQNSISVGANRGVTAPRARRRAVFRLDYLDNIDIISPMAGAANETHICLPCMSPTGRILQVVKPFSLPRRHLEAAAVCGILLATLDYPLEGTTGTSRA